MTLIGVLIKLINHSIGSLTKGVKIVLGSFPKKYDDCDIDPSYSFVCPENLSLGHWVYIGPMSFLGAKGAVSIEDGVVISSCVSILSCSHDYDGYESMPYDGRYCLQFN